MPTTPNTHAVDIHPWATLSCTSEKVWGSSSYPPYCLGCRILKNPASFISWIVSFGILLSALADSDLSLRIGMRSSAFLINSLWRSRLVLCLIVATNVIFHL